MTLRDTVRDQAMTGGDGEAARRIGAFAGAAVLVGLAAKRGSSAALGGAAAAALPLIYRGATGHWPLERAAERGHPLQIHTTLTIRRSAEDLYRFWRALENLPRLFRHVERVEVLDQRLSRWTAVSPIGHRVTWEAEITTDEPGHTLSWQSRPDSELEQRGRIDFREARQGRGTELEVTLEMLPPAGRMGAAVAGVLHPAIEREVREDLRRFKNLMEAGEVPTIEGQSHGERSTFSPENPF